MTYKIYITHDKLALFGANFTADSRAIEKLTARIQNDFPAITGVTLYQAPIPGVPTTTFLLAISDDQPFDLAAFKEFISQPKLKSYGVGIESVLDEPVPPPDEPPVVNPEV